MWVVQMGGGGVGAEACGWHDTKVLASFGTGIRSSGDEQVAGCDAVGDEGGDGGGGEGGVPKIFSSNHTPRTMGEVSTPLAVAVITAGMVRMPPRRGSPVGTRIMRSPGTSSRLYIQRAMWALR